MPRVIRVDAIPPKPKTYLDEIIEEFLELDTPYGEVVQLQHRSVDTTFSLWRNYKSRGRYPNVEMHRREGRLFLERIDT